MTEPTTGRLQCKLQGSSDLFKVVRFDKKASFFQLIQDIATRLRVPAGAEGTLILLVDGQESTPVESVDDLLGDGDQCVFVPRRNAPQQQAASEVLIELDLDEPGPPRTTQTAQTQTAQMYVQGWNSTLLSVENIKDESIRSQYRVRENGQFYFCPYCDHIRQVEAHLKPYMNIGGKLPGDYGDFVDQLWTNPSARGTAQFRKMLRHIKGHHPDLPPDEMEKKLPPLFKMNLKGTGTPLQPKRKRKLGPADLD